MVGPAPSSLVKNAVRLRRMPGIITRQDGAVIAVNKKRTFETPFFLQSNPPNNNVTFGALAVSQTQPMRVAQVGPMQIARLGVLRTGTCTVMIYINDGTSPQRLMNVPQHIDAIFGTGGQMYPLPEGLYIDDTRALSIAYTDLANNGNNAAQAAFSAARYGLLQDDPTLARIKQRLSQKEYMSAPFWLSPDQGSTTLAAFANTQVTCQIPQSMNYEIHQISTVSTGTFSINITLAESGVSLINAPSNTNYMVPSLLFCGNNQYPYKLSEPWLVYGGQVLTINLADTSGSSNTVWISICGKQVTQRQWS